MHTSRLIRYRHLPCHPDHLIRSCAAVPSTHSTPTYSYGSCLVYFLRPPIRRDKRSCSAASVSQTWTCTSTSHITCSECRTLYLQALVWRAPTGCSGACVGSPMLLARIKAGMHEPADLVGVGRGLVQTVGVHGSLYKTTYALGVCMHSVICCRHLVLHPNPPLPSPTTLLCAQPCAAGT